MMPLIDIQLNAMTHEVIMQFMEIANFDIVPLENIFPEVFDMPEGESYNDILESFDFDSPFFIYNLGTPLLIILWIFILMFVLFVILEMPRSGARRCKNIQKLCLRRSQKLVKSTFWSTPISILQESFMIVLLSALIHIILPHRFEKMTFGQKLNNWFAYIFFMIYIITPIVTIIILFRKFDNLNNRQFFHKYFTLYEELDTTKKWPVVIFRTQFYLRRFLIVAAILFTEQACFQIMLLFLQVFLHIFVVGLADPYEHKSKRNQELGNEFVIVLSVYHVMCFTPVVVDIDTRIYIGYSFIALILAHTLASLGILVWSMIKDSLWQLKKSRVIKHALIRERTKRIDLRDQKKKMA